MSMTTLTMDIDFFCTCHACRIVEFARNRPETWSNWYTAHMSIIHWLARQMFVCCQQKTSLHHRQPLNADSIDFSSMNEICVSLAFRHSFLFEEHLSHIGIYRLHRSTKGNEERPMIVYMRSRWRRLTSSKNAFNQRKEKHSNTSTMPPRRTKPSWTSWNSSILLWTRPIQYMFIHVHPLVLWTCDSNPSYPSLEKNRPWYLPQTRRNIEYVSLCTIIDKSIQHSCEDGKKRMAPCHFDLPVGVSSLCTLLSVHDLEWRSKATDMDGRSRRQAKQQDRVIQLAILRESCPYQRTYFVSIHMTVLSQTCLF